MKKQCSNCHLNKRKKDFYESEFIKINGGQCKQCLKIKHSKYHKKNKKKIAIKKHNDYLKNKSRDNKRSRMWYYANRSKVLKQRKKYSSDSSNKKNRNKREKIRRQEDIFYRLRKNMSSLIRHKLKSQLLNKNKKSVKEILPYTIEELKKHLEKQFEPWMNWNNYGKYNAKKWDDKNPKTWTWNIDHIIPQFRLPFNSIKHKNFKKAWALKNLRPYSAKQNILDGVRKIDRNKK